FFVELAKNRVEEAFGFQIEPEFHLVRRKAEVIVRRVFRCTGIEALPTGTLYGFTEFARRSVLCRLLLSLRQVAFQLFETGRVGLTPVAPLDAEREEGSVDTFERSFLFLRIVCADVLRT